MLLETLRLPLRAHGAMPASVKIRWSAGVLTSAGIAAAAAAWYASRSTDPPVADHTAEQQTHLPSHLLAPVKFEVRAFAPAIQQFAKPVA